MNSCRTNKIYLIFEQYNISSLQIFEMQLNPGRIRSPIERSYRSPVRQNVDSNQIYRAENFPVFSPEPITGKAHHILKLHSKSPPTFLSKIYSEDRQFIPAPYYFQLPQEIPNWNLKGNQNKSIKRNTSPDTMFRPQLRSQLKGVLEREKKRKMVSQGRNHSKVSQTQHKTRLSFLLAYFPVKERIYSPLANPNKSILFFKQQQKWNKNDEQTLPSENNSIAVPDKMEYPPQKNMMQSTIRGQEGIYIFKPIRTSVPEFFMAKASRKIQIRDFLSIRRLGRGTYGEAFLMMEIRTGLLCVIKIIPKTILKNSKLCVNLLRQIKVQSFLQHRHIVSLYGFFADFENVYLILEPMVDNSLIHVAKRKAFSEKSTALVVMQICSALKQLHSHHIIHRDIKLENILLHKSFVKLGDFGCAVHTLKPKSFSIGCIMYFSPQQLKNQEYDHRVDLWSLGVLTYEMLTESLPYKEEIIRIINKQIPPELPELTFSKGLSENAKDFVRRLLMKVPAERMSLFKAVQHPFLTENVGSLDDTGLWDL